MAELTFKLERIAYDSIPATNTKKPLPRQINDQDRRDAMILLIDNYDSLLYNLAQYIGNFAEVKVLRNDDAGLIGRQKK